VGGSGVNPDDEYDWRRAYEELREYRARRMRIWLVMMAILWGALCLWLLLY